MCASSITSVRGRVRALVEQELGRAEPRAVVILAVDGIPYEVADARWRRAAVSKMISVFPTTSSTAWMSSVTGDSVDTHGVPGVVFRVPGMSEPVDVFKYRGPALDREVRNLFSDAAERGYDPYAVLGDLDHLECSWRDALLQHSTPIQGFRFFTAPTQERRPEALAGRLRSAIETALSASSKPVTPRLVWCFVDADQHIHRHGYDEHLLRFLDLIDETAAALTANGEAVVVAHSDHGLVRTRHDPALARLFARLGDEHGAVLGGAGRTRWLYVGRDRAETVRDQLLRELPPSVGVHMNGDFFTEGSAAAERAGDLVLVAAGEEFVTSPGYSFDHGSLAREELEVPYAEWMGS